MSKLDRDENPLNSVVGKVAVAVAVHFHTSEPTMAIAWRDLSEFIHIDLEETVYVEQIHIHGVKRVILAQKHLCRECGHFEYRPVPLSAD